MGGGGGVSFGGLGGGGFGRSLKARGAGLGGGGGLLCASLGGGGRLFNARGAGLASAFTAGAGTTQVNFPLWSTQAGDNFVSFGWKCEQKAAAYFRK